MPRAKASKGPQQPHYQTGRQVPQLMLLEIAVQKVAENDMLQAAAAPAQRQARPVNRVQAGVRRRQRAAAAAAAAAAQQQQDEQQEDEPDSDASSEVRSMLRWPGACMLHAPMQSFHHNHVV